MWKNSEKAKMVQEEDEDEKIQKQTRWHDGFEGSAQWNFAHLARKTLTLSS